MGRMMAALLALLVALAACEGDTIYLPPRGDAGGGNDARDGRHDAVTAPDLTNPADLRPRPDLGPGPDVPDGPDVVRPPDVPRPPDTGEPATCRPNDDGVVTRAEVVPVYGAVAQYLANAAGTTVPVDVDGAPDPAAPGAHVWDFRAGPRDVARGLRVERFDRGAWYAPNFPDDVTYVTALGPQTPDILGIFRFEGDDLRMLGLASREDGPARTLLVYDDPVTLYRFPLEVGRTWTAESTFSNAWLQGARQAGRERYRFQVDRAGTVVLPNFTFTSVVRIRMDVTQTFVVSQDHNTLHSVHYFWFTECVGELARVVGPLTPDPPGPVTEAREFRRLGL
jgi:hypothetical protein